MKEMMSKKFKPVKKRSEIQAPVASQPSGLDGILAKQRQAIGDLISN